MTLAYYMFVNHGWAPHQVAELPLRERVLMIEMMVREAKARQQAVNKGGR